MKIWALQATFHLLGHHLVWSAQLDSSVRLQLRHLVAWANTAVLEQLHAQSVQQGIKFDFFTLSHNIL